jgi:hypothetical protein
MSKIHPLLNDALRGFIDAQHVFFVATAPSGSDGHVNVSPKGLRSLRVLGPTALCYLDFVGSGVETIAHLRENGRIVIMFCAFEGAPRILRLHGRGTVIEPQEPEFAALAADFETQVGARAIIHIELTRISESCGFGVPLYSYTGERPHLVSWASHRTTESLAAYQRDHNARSIDGLAGLRWTEAEGRDD